MRYLCLLLALVLVACGGDDKDKKPATAALSGFWDSNLTADGQLRILMYNDEVYAKDGKRGYYGSFTYTAGAGDVAMDLRGYEFVTQSGAGTNGLQEAQGQKVASGTANVYKFSGLHVKGALNYIQGNFANDKQSGLSLSNDNIWDTPSSINSVAGEWKADGYTLSVSNTGYFYANNLGGENASGTGDGCNFRGKINLIDTNRALYAVNLQERKDCSAFNKTAQGYAAVNNDGELEFYLRNGNELLFMNFAPGVAPTPPAPDPEGGAGDNDNNPGAGSTI